MDPMITDTAVNEGREVIHQDGRSGTLGITYEDLSFDVTFGTETIRFAEPDRQFFVYA